MTNKLLAVIAINLTILTGLMVLQNVPTAQAQGELQRVVICDQYYNSNCASVSNGGIKVWE